MTFDEWVKAYKNVKIDYDKVYGVQCVDLIKSFVKNVLEVSPESIGHAIEYYNKRNTSSYLKKNFTNYDYKKGFKFKKGDVLVLKGSSIFGHIAVCTGQYDSSGVYAYDENYKGKGYGMTLRYYEYKGYYKPLNILRPKEQTKISRPFGVDISEHDGRVYFNKLKKKVDFVIIRLGFRGYGSSGSLNLDKKFKYNYKWASKRNIPIGIFFYSQATTEKEAIEEAQFVIKQLKKRKLNLPVYFDTEYAEDGKGNFIGRLYNAKLSKDKLTKICAAFCKTVTAAGYRAGVYANLDFFTNKFKPEQLSSFSLWCAYYSKTNPQSRLKVKIDLWQNSNKGLVDGVTGECDTDYLYNDIIKKG